MQTLESNALLRRITFAGDCIQHGLADFLSQEEMDRYRGFWWTPDSKGIFFTQVDESNIPIYRIMHQQPPTTSKTCNSSDQSSLFYSCNDNNSNSFYSTKANSSSTSCCAYEDHRYPFAGCGPSCSSLAYLCEIKLALRNRCRQPLVKAHVEVLHCYCTYLKFHL